MECKVALDQQCTEISYAFVFCAPFSSLYHIFSICFPQEKLTCVMTLELLEGEWYLWLKQEVSFMGEWNGAQSPTRTEPGTSHIWT